MTTHASSSRDTQGDAPDERWRVSYAADLQHRSLTFHDGELILRRDALRLNLVDDRGVIVDARFLRAGEFIDIGDIISLPCYFARIRERSPAVSAPPAGATHGTIQGAVHGRHSEIQAGADRGGVAPHLTNHPLMAAGRVGAPSWPPDR